MGMIFYYKSFLEPYIKVLKRENLYVWVKMNKDLFTNFNSDIFFCVVYRPPSRSKYSDDNCFDQLSSDLLDYCDQTNKSFSWEISMAK